MTSPLVFPVSADWWSGGDPALTATTSAPEWLPISGLVTFTPRLPKGFTAYTASFPVAGNVNAVQTLTLLGAPDGGTYTISYGGYTTTNLAPNATVTSPQAFEYVVTFTGTLANQPIALLTTDGHLLTNSGGNTVSITVVMTTPGTTARNAKTGVVIPTRQGRIWAGQLCSIDVNDSPNVQLISNDPALNLIDQNVPSLIYDVMFTQVQYDSTTGALQNFAFAAPPDTTAVCLTDPTFPRLTFQPPPA